MRVHGWGAALCALFLFGAPAVRADAALFFVRGVGTSNADQRAVRGAAEAEFRAFNQPLVDQSKNASCADDASCRAVVLKRMGDANGIGFELFRVGQNLSVTVLGYRFDGQQALRYEKSVNLNDGKISGTLLNEDALAFFSAGREMAPLPPPAGAQSSTPVAEPPATPAATTPAEKAPAEKAPAEKAPAEKAPAPMPPDDNEPASENSPDAASPQTSPTAGDATSDPTTVKTPDEPAATTPESGATVESEPEGIPSGYILAGAGAVFLAAGAVIAASGVVGTLYGVAVRSDPQALRPDKESAQIVGWVGLAAIGWSGFIAAGGILLVAIGVGWALAEGE